MHSPESPTRGSGAAVAVAGLTVRRGNAVVLDRLNLEVPAGTVTAILGASGSGKSTLLRAVCGLLPPDEGTISLDGRDVSGLPTHRRQVAMVFQDDQLFDHLDVYGNVDYGLRRARWSRADRAARVHEILTLVGLADLARRRVSEVSGGEAKRVALARALAPQPRVLMADEPLSGLDRALHHRLLRDIATVLADHGTTTIWVTHDPDEANTIANTVRRLGPTGSLVHIGDLSPSDTHDLRRRVLRDGSPDADVAFAGDDDPSTTHRGVVDDVGRILAISSWYRRDHNDVPGGVQLRSMATEPDYQGTGLGAMLIDDGLHAASAHGAAYVWARARSTAEEFYTARGFTASGDTYIDETTQLPHRNVIMHLR